MRRTVNIPACCPHEDCGKSLLNNEVQVCRRPSVHLIVEKGKKRGDIYLSSWYDDFRCVEPDELHLLPGDKVKFYCPYCGKELPFVEKCACKAPMVALGIEGNGSVRICTRIGCHYHSLEFGNTAELIAFMSKVKKAKS